MIELRRTAEYIRWFDSPSDRKTPSVIARCLIRLELGHFGDVKSIGNGISELLIHFGPGFRIYFVQRGNSLIILLAGGDKGSQRSDMAMAKKLANTF